jgi:hypothetical protein
MNACNGIAYGSSKRDDGSKARIYRVFWAPGLKNSVQSMHESEHLLPCCLAALLGSAVLPLDNPVLESMGVDIT